MANVTRYKVTRMWVKYPTGPTGKVYKEGMFLPPEFTERDKWRTLYPSRISSVEVHATAVSGGDNTVTSGAANKGSAVSAATVAPQVPPAASEPEAKGTNADNNPVEPAPKATKPATPKAEKPAEKTADKPADKPKTTKASSSAAKTEKASSANAGSANNTQPHGTNDNPQSDRTFGQED